MKGFQASQDQGKDGVVFPGKKGRPPKYKPGKKKEQWSNWAQDSKQSDLRTHGNWIQTAFKIRQHFGSVESLTQCCLYKTAIEGVDQDIKQISVHPKSRHCFSHSRVYVRTRCTPSDKFILVPAINNPTLLPQRSVKLSGETNQKSQDNFSVVKTREQEQESKLTRMNTDQYTSRSAGTQFHPEKYHSLSLNKSPESHLPDVNYISTESKEIYYQSPVIEFQRVRRADLLQFRPPESINFDSIPRFRKPRPKKLDLLSHAGKDSNNACGLMRLKKKMKNYLEPNIELESSSERNSLSSSRRENKDCGFEFYYPEVLFDNPKVLKREKGLFPWGKRLMSKGLSDTDDRLHSMRPLVMTRCKSKPENS